MPTNAIRALVCHGFKRARAVSSSVRAAVAHAPRVYSMFSSSRGSADRYLVLYCVFSSMSSIDSACRSSR